MHSIILEKLNERTCEQTWRIWQINDYNLNDAICNVPQISQNKSQPSVVGFSYS